MLSETTSTVLAISRLPLVLLNTADSYPLSSTNNSFSHAKTNLIATANPSQTIYKPKTAPKLDLFASLLSSSSVRTVNPKKTHIAVTQKNTVPLFALNKFVRNFDRLDHQCNPEEHLNQTDAHIVFAIGEQPPSWRCSLYSKAQINGIITKLFNWNCLGWFLRRHESYKNDRSAFLCALSNNFFPNLLYII